MYPDDLVNAQLNQEKTLYMETFQRGGDNQIVGLKDVLFVISLVTRSMM